MHRAMIEQHLAMADRHVTEGMRHVEEQRARVAELARDNHDTTLAIHLLVTLQHSLALHIEDRDRLRAELAESKPAT